MEDLLAIEEQIDSEVRSLETCTYSHSVFCEILGHIQKAVDDLSLNQYSNLPQWVAKLDQEVELKLAHRLEYGLDAWVNTLIMQKEDTIDLTMDTDPAQGAPQHKPGGEPIIRVGTMFRVPFGEAFFGFKPQSRYSL